MRATKRHGLSAVIATVAIFILFAALSGPAKGDPLVVKELVRGSNIHGVNGMYFDAQDRLYIASGFGREIVVMDPLTGKIIERLGTQDGVENPDDLIFGPDGSLYWTSIYTGIVGRRSPDGTTTTVQYVSLGANPITFSHDGRLFVALDFLGDGLYELDPKLASPPRPIIVASPENPYPLGFLNGFEFGPDGRLYGPLFAAGMVISIDVDSCENTSSPWTDCDIQVVATGFTNPAAAKFDSQGRLCVVDYPTGEVFRVDIDSGAKSIITVLSPGLDNLAFDSKGNLYVSNYPDGSVTRVLPNDKPRTLNKPGMIFPGGVAVLPKSNGESVFVADLGSLREFDGLTGRQFGHWIGSLTSQGFLPPLTVSADGANLILTSLAPASVQVWNPDTAQVLDFYPMVLPLNAIRFQSDVIVADPGLGGLVWASDHQLALGQPTVFVPSGLAASGNTLWFADWATGTVWQIEFSGRTAMTPMLIATGLSSPEGLALDLDESLLVVEAGAGRLSRIDPATSTVTVVAEGLELGEPTIPIVAPPTWAFNGVAVGPSGAIYVTGDTANVVYRIWPR